MSRYTKRTVLVAFDIVVLSLIAYAALVLRYASFWPLEDLYSWALFAIGPVVMVATYGWFGQYRLVTRFIGWQGSLQIASCSLLGMMIWALLVFMSGQHGVPRSVILAFGIIAAIVIPLTRQVAGWVLRNIGVSLRRVPLDIESKPVLIYGAGEQGVQLAEFLRALPDRHAVAFVDPETSLKGQYVNGLKVFLPERLESIVQRQGVKEVFIAVPGIKKRLVREIVTSIEHLPVAVKVMPDMGQLARGEISLANARPIDVQDLLGRDPVPPHEQLLSRSVQGQSVLVTGAGGSVGSELVRQILDQGPQRLVLIDVSEAALYLIHSEIGERLNALPADEKLSAPEVIPLMGSVLDEAFVAHAIATYEVDTIYHAAAYKHVPLVESNVEMGLANNTFGCQSIAQIAKAQGVSRFVLISTDKAVRPTNVMGASKRLSEMVLQSLARQPDNQTIFTMVRFGNVLDSSGSVVQTFRRQIEAGGPITVTHPDVIRYFMSIPEAASLVIQAGAMAEGGEVFVLDMGEPVKIVELARLMARLSGLEIRDENNPEGDIEVVFTGLRPGEKLFEELLIGSNTSGTEHPRILRSHEPCPPREELEAALMALGDAIDAHDLGAIQDILLDTVEGYAPNADLQVGLPGAKPASWRAASRVLH